VPRDGRERQVVITCFANAVEWYDFAVYGALASVLAAVLLPGGGGASGIVTVFAVFASSFLARPLGALLVGVRLADRSALILGMPRGSPPAARTSPTLGDVGPARAPYSERTRLRFIEHATDGLPAAAEDRREAAGARHHTPRRVAQGQGPGGGVTRRRRSAAA
jgi:hypothetical protein